MYQQLIEEYNQLDEIEKNALLIYKSRLGRAINALDNNEKEIEKIYYQYKKLLDDPKNLFMKLVVFKDVKFDSIENFKESLRCAKNEIIVGMSEVISNDITLYRAISIPKQNSLIPISKTDFISTSQNLNECTKFLIPNRGYNHYLYQINLEKGSKVAVCPYAILLNSKEQQLLLSQTSDQEEFILSKNDYDFEQVQTTKTKLENDEILNIVVVNAKPKQKNINLNRSSGKK